MIMDKFIIIGMALVCLAFSIMSYKIIRLKEKEKMTALNMTLFTANVISLLSLGYMLS